MKNFLLNCLFSLIFISGLCIMLYPTVSDWINRRHQSTAIASYEFESDAIEKEERARIIEEAREYNRNLSRLLATETNVTMESNEQYLSALNISSSGMMGVIAIDKIKVNLPIYHGTSDAVLQAGAGHIAVSSLPVGGESTHALISAHTGLPSAKLFTDLDQLELGDIFKITVLDEVLVYRVDKIDVVLPEEVSELIVTEGEDYVTLVTCTPYGINSHRLLVRGTRVPYEEAEKAGYLVNNEAVFVDKTLLIPVAVVPMLAVYFIWTLVSTNRAPEKKKKEA